MSRYLFSFVLKHKYKLTILLVIQLVKLNEVEHLVQRMLSVGQFAELLHILYRYLDVHLVFLVTLWCLLREKCFKLNILLELVFLYHLSDKLAVNFCKISFSCRFSRDFIVVFFLDHDTALSSDLTNISHFRSWRFCGR